MSVLKFGPMKDGVLVVAQILHYTDHNIDNHIEFSVAAGTIPSETDAARYNDDTELQAIIRGIMFPNPSTTASNVAQDNGIRYLAPAFPEDEVCTLLLEAKGMLPLHIDARQSMTVADLCLEFKRQRYVAKATKIEAWCQGIELPEYYHVGRLGLKKSETIHMRVRWEE